MTVSEDTLTCFSAVLYISGLIFQHFCLSQLSVPSFHLTLLSRLELLGFWLSDWPTDADLLNLRKHSKTPECCAILWHIFLYKPTFC